MNDIYKRYFIFSRDQMEMKQKLSAERGQVITFGTVIVNGSPKVFTDIILDPEKIIFPDSIILISGDIRYIKYKEPKGV